MLRAPMTAPPVPPPSDHTRFAIGFDPRDRPKLHALWDEKAP
jgi:hypothetical protein